jgi:hypothetical protein
MSMNYVNTFIQIAPDCPVDEAVVPPARGGKKSIPLLEYEMLSGNPYVFTQEEILFEVHAQHKGIPESKLKSHRKELWEVFYSQSRACLRASSLPKKYGWGIHFNAEGKAALVPMESTEYRQFVGDKNITQFLAMRSKRG